MNKNEPVDIICKLEEEMNNSSILLNPLSIDSFLKTLKDIKNHIEELEDVNSYYSEEVIYAINHILDCFRNALLLRSNEKTAIQALAAISDIIRILKKPVAKETESEIKDVIQHRELAICRLATLLEFQDYYDELQIRIEKLEEREKDCLAAKENAEKIYAEVEPLSDYYESQANKVISGLREPDLKLYDYIDRVNAVVDRSNDYVQVVLLRELLKKRSETIIDVIHRINLMVYGSVELLGQKTIADLNNLIASFEDNVIDMMKESEDLDNFNSSFDSVLEVAAPALNLQMKKNKAVVIKTNEDYQQYLNDRSKQSKEKKTNGSV